MHIGFNLEDILSEPLFSGSVSKTELKRSLSPRVTKRASVLKFITAGCNYIRYSAMAFFATFKVYIGIASQTKKFQSQFDTMTEQERMEKLAKIIHIREMYEPLFHKLVSIKNSHNPASFRAIFSNVQLSIKLLDKTIDTYEPKIYPEKTKITKEYLEDLHKRYEGFDLDD